MKMQNKRAKQIEEKRRHREQLKSRRRQEPVLERATPNRTEKPTILIVCEGKNTEPSYFNQFKLSSATVKVVGSGFNTKSLVKEAIRLSEEKKYDQVWCVFDADPKHDNSKQADNFNEAIRLIDSKRNKQNVWRAAYSNQAFEYWIILHFEDHQGSAMPRGDYNKKINDLLNVFKLRYDGNGSKIITVELFEELFKEDKKFKKRRVHLAIERARRNCNRHAHLNPARAESSTTVFLLVEELLKYVDI